MSWEPKYGYFEQISRWKGNQIGFVEFLFQNKRLACWSHELWGELFYENGAMLWIFEREMRKVKIFLEWKLMMELFGVILLVTSSENFNSLECPSPYSNLKNFCQGRDISTVWKNWTSGQGQDTLNFANF